jgi:hypothetical protein
VYVEQKDFAKRAKQLVKDRVQGAVYTKFVPSRPQEATIYGNDDQRIGYNYFDNRDNQFGPKTNASFASYIQREREMANHLSRKKSYHERVNFLNSVERVVADITRQFRGYIVTDVHVYHTVKGKHKRGVFNFHADHSNSDGYLTVVATPEGPSTVYRTLGEFHDEIFLPDGALVAHTGTVMHRSPVPVDNSVRLAIVIEMKKKS